MVHIRAWSAGLATAQGCRAAALFMHFAALHCCLMPLWHLTLCACSCYHSVLCVVFMVVICGCMWAIMKESLGSERGG